MELDRYENIIWDWNGTLLDDAWLCVEIMNDLLGRQGLPKLSLERYQRVFDFPVIDYYQRLGFRFEEAPFETWSDLFMGEYDRRRFECRLREGVEPLLGDLLARGHRQSILSAAKQSSLQEAVAHFGIERNFVEILGVDDHHAFGKGHIGRLWAEQAHIDLTRTLFIGDTVHDREVAAEMGVDCVLIAGGHQHPERLGRCDVPVISFLSELNVGR